MNVPTKDTNPKDAIAGNKVPLALCSPIAKAHWALAQFAGMAKYGAWNWRLCGVRSSVYMHAMQRHMDAYLSGEDTDPVDGTHHLGNIMACAAIILDSAEAGKLTDDRPPRLSLRGAYASLEGLATRLIEQYKDRTPRHATIADVVIPESPKVPTFGPVIVGTVVDHKVRTFQTVAEGMAAIRDPDVDPYSNTVPSYPGALEEVPLTETDPDADPETEQDSTPPVHASTGDTLPSQPIVDPDKPYRVIHYSGPGVEEADTSVDDAVDAFRLLQAYQNCAKAGDRLEVLRRAGYGWESLYHVEA